MPLLVDEGQMWSPLQPCIYECLLSPGARATWVLASHPGRPCKSVPGSSGTRPRTSPHLGPALQAGYTHATLPVLGVTLASSPISICFPSPNTFLSQKVFSRFFPRTTVHHSEGGDGTRDREAARLHMTTAWTLPSGSTSLGGMAGSSPRGSPPSRQGAVSGRQLGHRHLPSLSTPRFLCPGVMF